MTTVDALDIPKFMGSWYVLAGRFTFLEDGAHNGVEKYTWNEKENRIDVDFTFRKDGFGGKKKSIPQKAWVYNKETNAHWKISPFWPFKLDYLVVALDENYQWTAVGVPNQKYLWIMARDWQNPEPIIEAAKQELKKIGYNIDNIVRSPQQWPTESDKN